jgi:hypothetical protein
MTDCFHWCRGINGVGHDWSHSIKDAGVALDSFRLFCPTHGAEVAQKILSGTNDVLAQGREQQRRQESLEDYAQPISFPMVGDGNLVESLALAYQAADEESEMLSLY